MDATVLTDERGPVTVIRLNRPQRHNALVPELLEGLLAAFHDLGPGVKAVVLAAEGRSFSTGGDVAALRDHEHDLEAYASLLVGRLNEVIITMVALAQPIVVAVHGIVTGGSLGLVMAGDAVLVSPAASFTPWYGVVGFSPDGGWTAMLPDIIGRRRTSDVLLHNRTITAHDAVSWGLANRIVPAERIREEAIRSADAAGGLGGGVSRHARVHRWGDVARLAANLEEERQRFVRKILTSGAREGMERFLDR